MFVKSEKKLEEISEIGLVRSTTVSAASMYVLNFEPGKRWEIQCGYGVYSVNYSA